MARRGRRRGRRGGGAARGDTALGDWIVGPGTVASDGTFSAGPTWGVDVSVVAGTPEGVSLVKIDQVASPAPTTPTIGELTVTAVHGEIVIFPKPTSSLEVLCVGMMFSKFMRSTGKWEILDPGAQLDAQRNEWMHLQAHGVPFQLALGVLANYVNQAQPVTIPFSFKTNVRLGDGEQLLLCLGQQGEDQIDAQVFLRSHIRIS